MDSCLFCEGDGSDETFWVQCEVCPQWAHVNCIPLESISSQRRPRKAAEISQFSCNKHGKTLLVLRDNVSHKRSPKDSGVDKPDAKRRGLRRKKEVDYIALNDGGEKRLKTEHPHVSAFLKCFDQWENTSNVMDATDFETNFNSIAIPIKINDPENSGMKVPDLGTLTQSDHGTARPEFSVEGLTEVLGPDYSIDVMDVQSQENSRWPMREWNDYFTNTSAERRDRIRNVISLEVSHIDGFKTGIRRPKAVDNNDLVSKVWHEIDDETEPPKVTKYILMSVANAYTDFHLDFAGTSVYYNIISGAKKFILFPPTEHNLQKYCDWCQSDHQNLIFLGDQLEKGIAMDLRSSDLFMIPSGYIHAVYTPVDSLIIGGNFLTVRDILTQLRVVEIERLTKVPKRFTFPNFDAVMGKTCEYLVNSSNRDIVSKPQILALLRYMRDPKVKYKPVKSSRKRDLIDALEKQILG
ncbi:LAMI_0G12398g1_1 [Lachancea mirantina]|uniref:JmjC domain-containing histone demethylation protein 1 n=1 Tax=Lachancea mirantina TaxID=1230905 RepID=A0A1G4KBD7_9SACH|nr:LAMI_0G12398g1_1 [Lachancea mirantina]